MTFPYEEFDVSDVHTYALKSRHSKARFSDFARPYEPGTGVPGLLDSLPNILASADFVALVKTLKRTREAEDGIVWGLGAHIVKTGLSPVIIDLMERGFVSAIATNGAGMIHDFEVAIAGATSEEVDKSLDSGKFGMADETGRVLNEEIAKGVTNGLGIGQAVGDYLLNLHPPFEQVSIFANAARLNIPVTVHVAVGTDVIHMHPAASGEALGAGSLKDFYYFVSSVSRLANGVYLNCGSAVLLPEVFLKAVSLVRNRGVSLENLTTVNLDFLRQYRPQANVVRRPTSASGRGISLVGHHEILVPLLAAALVESVT